MSMNALVVDDSAVMRAMLIRTLRMSGLPLSNVYQSATAAEALEVLAGHEVDIAFVDSDLPSENGDTLVGQIRVDARLAGLSVVLVCAEGADTSLGALESKGVALLRKPFTPEKVRATVLKVLGVVDA